LSLGEWALASYGRDNNTYDALHSCKDLENDYGYVFLGTTAVAPTPFKCKLCKAPMPDEVLFARKLLGKMYESDTIIKEEKDV
jgi:hypothetical protein